MKRKTKDSEAWALVPSKLAKVWFAMRSMPLELTEKQTAFLTLEAPALPVQPKRRATKASWPIVNPPITQVAYPPMVSAATAGWTAEEWMQAVIEVKTNRAPDAPITPKVKTKPLPVRNYTTPAQMIRAFRELVGAGWTPELSDFAKKTVNLYNAMVVYMLDDEPESGGRGGKRVMLLAGDKPNGHQHLVVGARGEVVSIGKRGLAWVKFDDGETPDLVSADNLAHEVAKTVGGFDRLILPFRQLLDLSRASTALDGIVTEMLGFVPETTHWPTAKDGAEYVSYPVPHKAEGHRMRRQEVIEIRVPGQEPIKETYVWKAPEANGMTAMDWEAAHEGGYYEVAADRVPARAKMNTLGWRIDGERPTRNEKATRSVRLKTPAMPHHFKGKRPVCRIGAARQVVRTPRVQATERTASSTAKLMMIRKIGQELGKRVGLGASNPPSGTYKTYRRRLAATFYEAWERRNACNHRLPGEERKAQVTYWYSPEERAARKQRRMDKQARYIVKHLSAKYDEGTIRHLMSSFPWAALIDFIQAKNLDKVAA